MQYFQDFKKLNYRFGNETSFEVFQNISAYADIIDSVKDDAAFYKFEQIYEGFRPDQLSQKLYETPVYYWTFYLLNDNLRLQGWPLTNRELEEKVILEYPNTVITTRDSLTGIFKPGQTVVGSLSGSTGTMLHRNVELGQLVIEGTLSFTTTPAPEQVTSTFASPGGSTTQTITIVSSSKEHLAAHHYINAANEIVDIDPTVGPGAQLTEITNFQNYFNENEALRSIKTIKPNMIAELASSFKRAIRS